MQMMLQTSAVGETTVYADRLCARHNFLGLHSAPCKLKYHDSHSQLIKKKKKKKKEKKRKKRKKKGKRKKERGRK
ncbi:hypothetical protein PUN28_003322 [Cardiocondyla obscurior]|uniref:Uncharacterized protein n=1 Tax=Cardiocondyla obscurior TaxID=286306 RepID=A0AAW2GKG7_9HYME